MLQIFLVKIRYFKIFNIIKQGNEEEKYGYQIMF